MITDNRGPEYVVHADGHSPITDPLPTIIQIVDIFT